ncbi:Acyl-CoA 5-desaturase AL21 [Porphyridium purpureum]|uniref:Acyl-CoA 5-desaturase AL21 n=1 Tax=Porphyridium purpureum TaxID=35688 RepID=A0A5J4YMV4_PORPP|nr:Acyl-CoA 5-desaturase AL21 [Porphyridium purpureum]|eukprot:POR4873..scf244_11
MGLDAAEHEGSHAARRRGAHDAQHGPRWRGERAALAREHTLAHVDAKLHDAATLPQAHQESVLQRSGAKMSRPQSLSWIELMTSFNVLVFFGVHVGSLIAFWFSPSTPGTLDRRQNLALALVNYCVRMFGITAGYHRFFAHRSYKTSRVFQFILAVVGAASWQKGVLWWASWHRHHHRTADTQEDAHTPKKGFWWSHFGWFLFSNEYSEIKWELIPDLAAYPELRLLEKLHFVPGLVLAAACFCYGGIRAFLWGFCVSTTLLWHATFTINSLSHMYGSQRYKCEFHSECDARNNAFLALITLGEGWHNNHHSSMGSVRQGLAWYEFDVSFYTLSILRMVGLVFGFRDPPYEELERRRLRPGAVADGQKPPCVLQGTEQTSKPSTHDRLRAPGRGIASQNADQLKLVGLHDICDLDLLECSPMTSCDSVPESAPL